jgi:uncharacterized protein (TIGR00730 family)
MKRIAIFCGSSLGNAPIYQAVARDMAEALVAAELGLVYGGAQRGLMGVLADRVLELGGEVIGVIPARMVEHEIAHPHLTQLHVVQTMHERKALMAEHANAFLALPGGFGTLEELTEVVTWQQLGLHNKPCALLNTQGYFDPFIAFITHMTEAGFVRPAHAAAVHVAQTPRDALQVLQRQPGFAADS